MAVMDEFKEERALIKGQPFKKRFEYFWEYYKWHVFAVACIAFFITSYVYNIVTAKEDMLTVALIDCNSDEASAEDYTNELIDLMGLDPKEQTVTLDNSFFLSSADTMSYSIAEVFYVKIAAGDIDVVLSPEDTFNRYVQNDIFVDIRDFLSPEQIEFYQDSFYYVDYAVIESEDTYETDLVETEFVDTANHRSPENMEKPIPVGIYVTGTEEFQSKYYFQRASQEVVFGIVGFVEDGTYALQFLDNMTGRVE